MTLRVVVSLLLPVFSVALGAAVLLLLNCTASAADERCAQLVALSKQYAGVTLSDEQKEIKVKLVAWYKQNCGGKSRSIRHAGNS
jgi:hypothetical protein